jgi:hypothetical protein
MSVESWEAREAHKVHQKSLTQGDPLMRLAAKLLAPVEVSSSASHQHEFNAGQLRTALDLPKQKTSGQLEIVYLPRGDDDPVFETCGYTLYDAREGKPRAAEYRLYFASQELQHNARPGDILIVIRADDGVGLRALILPLESDAGSAIAAMLKAEGVEIEDRFHEITAVIREADLGQLLQVTAEKVTVVDAASFLASADRELIARAITDGRLPSTRAMADEAVRIVRSLRSGKLAPDDQLQWSLEAETALFQHIEERVSQKRLDDLAAAGHIAFVDAVTLVMAQIQSRKSRRGQSLQNHFRAVLDTHRIPYGAQCHTERDEVPDFLVPGCQQYLDPAFPPAALRMVACKSIVRERWRQILEEADRIPEKFLLTLDSGLTDDTILKMRQSSLRVFLPDKLLRSHYADRAIANELANVAQLVENIALAATGGH